MLIALDERIDDLIVASIFGESVTPAVDDDPASEAPRPRTPIETALVEEFARGLGRALEDGFAPAARLSLAFERLVTLADALRARTARHAGGRGALLPADGRRRLRGAGAAAAIPAAAVPQGARARTRRARRAAADRRWSHSMESEVKQTRLPVTAILEELSMTLGDVASFGVGTFLPLQSGDFESVRLECAGRGMFLCRLGQGDGRYRLEIETPIAQPLDPTRRLTPESSPALLETSTHGRTRPSPKPRRPRRSRQRRRRAAVPPPAAPNLNAILSIPVTVQVVLGSTSLPVSSLMKLARGAVISLDQRVGDPVDVVVNGKVVARGEIVVVDEASQRFGVSLLEIVAGAGLEQAA